MVRSFPLPVLLLLLTMMLMLAQGVAHAQPTIENRQDIQVPNNLNQLEFYLITVDVGANVWDNFGHTALRVVDNTTNTDLIFNWGLFDTSIGNLRFAANFARGIMNYQLGVAPPAWELGRYQAEGRSVWQDRLRLTAEQKRTLYQRLAWNLRPENISYDYEYFFDNCTTRVRDYLDEALGGALSNQTQVLGQRTFRDEVVDHYASVPVIAFSLNILMNGNIDERMTQWQRMFLPLQLREQLLRLGMIEESETVMSFAPPEAGPSANLISLLLALPMLLLLLSVRRASIASFSSQPGFALRAPAVSYRLLGLLGLIIALFSGVYGLIMSLGWWLSSHQDVHGNLNLLLFWPTDLLGLGVAFSWLLKGQAYTLSSTRQQFVTAYLVLHLLAALVYLVMALFGLGGQHLGSIALYVLPPLILYALVVMIAGMRPIRSFRWS